MEISMEIFTSPRIRLFISGVGQKKIPKCVKGTALEARTTKQGPPKHDLPPGTSQKFREWNPPV